MTHKKLICLITFAILSVAVHDCKAQDNVWRTDTVNYDSITVQTTLSDSMLAEFKPYVIELVKKFNIELTYLWNHRDPEVYTQAEWDTLQDQRIKTILKFFIGDGEPYPSNDTVAYRAYKDDYGNWYYKDSKGKRQYTDKIRKDEHGIWRIYIFESVMHPAVKMSVSSKTGMKPPQTVRYYLNRIRKNLYKKVVATYGGYEMADNFRLVEPGHYVGSVSYYQDFQSYIGDNRKGYSDRTYKRMTVHLFFREDRGIRRWEPKLGDTQVSVTENLPENNK